MYAKIDNVGVALVRTLAFMPESWADKDETLRWVKKTAMEILEHIE